MFKQPQKASIHYRYITGYTAYHLACAAIIVTLVTISGCTYRMIDIVYQRRVFLQAEQAFTEERTADYHQLKRQLRNYPLLAYLEYKEAQSDLLNSKEETTRDFLRHYPTTRLANRLRSIWLPRLAASERWHDFIEIAAATTKTTQLHCQQLTALIAIGKSQQAFQQITPLWLVGTPQPHVCEAPFNAWEKSGLLTADLTWQRIALAVAAKQPDLAKSLQRLLNAEDQLWVERWLNIYQKPEIIYNGTEFTIAHPWRETILISGLERLYQKSPRQVPAAWAMLKQHYKFNAMQLAKARQIVAQSYLRFATAEMLENITAIDGIVDISIQRKRIIYALTHKNWANVLSRIDALPSEEKAKPQWLYWRGRALQQMGQPDQAKAVLLGIVTDRTYYAFLAASRIGVDYHLISKPLEVEKNLLRNIANRDAALCARELRAIGRMAEARLEWLWLTKNLNPKELEAAAKLADQWGWHSEAIFTLAKSDFWHDLNMRFPLEHLDLIKQHSQTNGLLASWVLSVIRQESTFAGDAVSPSGAMGLMQLMPPTAKEVARKLGQPLTNTKDLFRPEVNIVLGTSYLSEVAQKFHHNLVLATAAYNAGPNRVMKWLPSKEMEADIWVETIPFQETRTYVQRVMAYMILYEQRLQLKPNSIITTMQPIKPARSFR